MNKDSSKVIYEEKNGIGYVIINDPPANKMTRLFWDDLYHIVTNEINKNKVKGIIIIGKGRHFSSGAEVDDLKKNVSEEITDSDKAYSPKNERDRISFDFFFNLDIPVISAVNGFCIGSALEFILATHIRIASKKAMFAAPESTFGIIPGVGGTLRCVEVCGIGKAIEIVMSGQTFSSEEALNMGIIDKIVEKQKIVSYSEELINYISETNTKYCKENIKEYINNFNNRNIE